MKSVFTIPPDAPFAIRLAEGLWRQAKGDPLALSQMLVLLPTRRATRYLREAFLDIPECGAALLPRMQPIGDLDEDELSFADNGLAPDLPPAIAPARRQMLLTQLVRKTDESMPLDQAAQLAQALGVLLDQVQTEGLDFSGLDKLVESDLAEHWKLTVEFLSIVTKAWPAMLDDEGCIDPALRRRLLIEAQTKIWRAAPPAFPVIAAGSTGSMPATAGLLAAIAELPQGAVVLPGLDRELGEDAWQEIGENHPQYAMKQWLELADVKREDVKLWPSCDPKISPRVRLLNESMRPAESSGDWRALKQSDIPQAALKNFSRIELENAQLEAQAIALILRGALETPDQIAALVTADRDLAERVAAQLRRWKIEVNDSAGSSLAVQPAGSFLRAILAACAPDADAVDYLTLLKHPLAAFGQDTAVCRAQAREAEIAIRRAQTYESRADGSKDALKAWAEQLAPLSRDWAKPLPLTARIDAHIMLAAQLAATDKEPGDARLWFGESGEAAAEWLAEWKQAGNGFPPLTGFEYEALFNEILRTVTLRPRYGLHPRLSILGPLEARMVEADLVVLGGLNEGSWPPDAAVDPWMSRPMKEKFGLPMPERRIGLSAHDFVQLASGPEVVLTRSRRAGNAPAVPSRFLLQLEAVLRALGYHDGEKDVLAPAQPWNIWAAEIDAPTGDIMPCPPPSPCPPADARPKQLRVTDIGTWRRNPYAIYAKHILKLQKLGPLQADPTARDRGTIIHDVLEKFMRQFPDLPPQAEEELLKLGRAAFAPYAEEPQVTAFWWPRFRRIAAWFVEHENERRAEGIKLLGAEAGGKINFPGFTLKGRADRIDQMPDGTLSIADYKTARIPAQAEVKAGYEPQLPLLALIAAQGGFDGIPAAQASALVYWKLTGGAEPGEECPVKESTDTLVTGAREGLLRLITHFAQPDTPWEAVPKPGLSPRYDDYAHLARLAEWGRTVEEN